MVKKLFTKSQIKKITGAKRSETVPIPFYFAPPFLDELRNWIYSHLSSDGGRPTIKGLNIVRKVRFSKEGWKELNQIAESFSKSGISVSPAQIASSIFEGFIADSKAKRE